MGGSNETRIEGLRLHVSEGNVHVHDDAKSLKFIEKKDMFKKEVNAALKDLEKSKNGGMVKIEGAIGALYISKENKNYSMFLVGSTSIKTQLTAFLKGC